MDLENELRRAMAEHVTEVSASRTLAHDARRRHHRTVRRRTAVAMTAAGLVVAVAAIPAYQSFRPATVGADGPGGRHHGTHAVVSPTPSPSVSPPHSGRPVTPAPGTAGSRPPGTTRSRHPASPHGSIFAVPTKLLGYLPAGIDPAKTCHTQQMGSRATTTCRWTGTAGWIEVRLVRDHGLSGPADLGFAPPMASQSQVHGHSALRGDGPAVPSQLMWIEHDGLGVWVGVSPSLSGRLVRVAEGVHAT
jgi:hypothetical protein